MFGASCVAGPIAYSQSDMVTMGVFGSPVPAAPVPLGPPAAPPAPPPPIPAAPEGAPAAPAAPSLGTQALQTTVGFDARVPGGHGEQLFESWKHPPALAAKTNPMKSQVTSERPML